MKSNNTRKFVLPAFSMIVLASLAILVTNARADLIAIEPAAYTGQYRVDGQGFVNGQIVVDLAVGSHTIGLGDIGFGFQVSPSGQVTPNNPANAVGGANTLTFKTVPINIEPNTYTGFYSVGFPSRTFEPGPRTVRVVPGISNYAILLGDIAFRFNVDDLGNVTPKKSYNQKVWK
jgi:hypothetical protein